MRTNRLILVALVWLVPMGAQAQTRVVEANSADALTSLQNIDTSLNNIESGLGQDCAEAAASSLCPSGPITVLKFDDTSPTTVSEDQTVRMRGSATGEAYSVIRDAAGNNRGANVNASNQLTVIDANSASALTALQLIDDIVGVEDAAETAGGGLARAGTVRRDTAASSAGASGDNATLNTDGLGRVWTRDGDPCADYARITTVAIDTAASGNVELVALNGSDLVYVCGLSVVVDGAVDIQLIYGTGTACATGETNLTGIWGFAANGGIALPSAGVPQFIVPAGNALCVETSGAVQTSGHVTYVRTAAP